MQSSNIFIESVDIDDSNDQTGDTEESQVKQPDTDEPFIRSFSNLILDQINEQDTNQILLTQRQMLVFLTRTPASLN
jgi:hypothetical protein